MEEQVQCANVIVGGQAPTALLLHATMVQDVQAMAIALPIWILHVAFAMALSLFLSHNPLLLLKLRLMVGPALIVQLDLLQLVMQPIALQMEDPAVMQQRD